MPDLIELLRLDIDLPEASDMRAKLKAAGTRVARAQFKELARQIEEATEQGKSTIYPSRSLAPGVREALERKGYKVYESRDQRDPGFSVSW